MAKIVAVTQDIVSIGMDDGTLRDIPASSLNFAPHIGDEVELFETADKIIVSKIEKSAPNAAPAQYVPNIVINNANSNTNTNIAGGAGHGTPKNKWTAFILCLFLGVVGAHKFYEGKIGTGILYIFTVGIFGIGVIIDLISILNKPNPYYV